MTSGPYARLYHSLVEDPMFERVYENDHALATWVRLLLTADAMYPVSAPMPPRTPTVKLLIEVGLLVEKPLNRFSVRGLQAERERRSTSGRIGAAVRWQSERNADAMPSRTEQNRAEQIDANASETTNGAPPPGVFMGYRPKAPKPGAHEGQHTDCQVCAPLRPKAAGA